MDTEIKKVRNPKMYLIRWRNPNDGSWSINVEDIMTKRKAEKDMQFARVMGGFIGQLWPYEEWMAKHHQAPTPEGETI